MFGPKREEVTGFCRCV